MEYLTKIYALNLENKLDTDGDWHFSALDWSPKNIQQQLHESEKSIYGDYGIEVNQKIPGYSDNQRFNIANHIRSLLDMIVDKEFNQAQGMREHFIDNEKYTREILEQVYKLRCLVYWKRVDAFMLREYGLTWIAFKKMKGEKIVIMQSNQEDTSWQPLHLKVIDQVLKEINKQTDQFVLKGGTALSYCYGLDRFSEDIDLDSQSKQNIISVIEKICHHHHYDLSVKKNTNTVKRVVIDYHSPYNKKLKIDTSYRPKGMVQESKLAYENGVITYVISELFSMKLDAFSDRYRIRDVYDIQYLFLNKRDKLSQSNVVRLYNLLQYKGLDELETLLIEQPDPLIDSDQLITHFLEMTEEIGIESNYDTSQSLTDNLNDRLEEEYQQLLEENDDLEL